MFRRASIVAALATSALLVPVATPAHAAEQSIDFTCSTTSGGPDSSPTIWGTAYYRAVSGGRRQYVRFTYFLGGSRVGYGGDDNNVNIRVFERYRVERIVNGEPVIGTRSVIRYSYDSPDNRRWGADYTLIPDRPIYTSASDVIPNDRISFQAIFDASLAGDPSCTATNRTDI